MSIEIQPYFAEGERYPALIGVRAEGDEYETAYVSKSELVDALADNAKLRELVRKVYTLHWNGLDCTECPWFDECDTAGGCPWLSIFADHMRELGVDE